MRFFRIPAIALALAIGVVAGCEEIGSPVSTDAASRPSFDMTDNSGPTLQVVRLNWPDTVTYVIEGTFGKGGGVLDIGPHKLVISRGAVAKQTRFVFTAVLGEYLIMDLRAFDAKNGKPVTQFNADVDLSMSYEDLKWMGDPKKLTVVYLQDGTPTGRKEKINTEVNQRDKKATGKLRHFSIYTMAIE